MKYKCSQLKISYIIFGLLFYFVSFTSVYAALNLELTQGVNKALPIAVLSFSVQHNIAKIISSDLQNSGQFKVDQVDAPQQLSYGMHAANYAYWAGQKMNNVVLGSVEKDGKKYKVKFQLLDVYSKSVLLDKEYKVSKDDLRALAHHISDLVYQQLIGQRGVFSTKIAYVLVQRKIGQPTKHSLIVADADGHNPKQLLLSSEPIMSPAWSPDGKKLAYVSFEHKHSAIYIQNIATGKRHLVSNYPGINGAPAFSPDGRKLALVLSKTGYPKIYVLDLVTHKLKQKTFGWSLDTEPSWSATGEAIIFTSNRGGTPQIYQLDLASNAITRLTYQGSYNARASFMPDGKSIVMLSRDDNGFNIAKEDLVSGDVTVLTSSGMNESPSVAPNGSMIVYATNYRGRGTLAEVSADGRVELRLPSKEGEVQEPAWSGSLVGVRSGHETAR
ncbi:MAG: Tol-Pal system beta propeller repeat protein TolB [Gammaproteobacteria bacterium]|nr:Tol-Pal system beta propeller repeat protein TolB [Gammaproteobacteria bacterium]